VRHRLVAPTLLATAVAVAYGWAELTGYAWTDYELFNEGPLRALVHGHLGVFFKTAPIEGPSLLIRSPFAFAAWLWGGSDIAVYRMVAVPGLLAGVVLAVTLWELRARRYPRARWGLLVVALVAGNPLMLEALAIGHPEELLGSALCVGAVLAALHKRPWLAAVLLGLALGHKAWAVLAIGPVLLALDRRRWSVLALASGIAALLVAPFLLAESSQGTMAAAGGTFDMFQPWQIWWPLGEHGHAIYGFFGMAKEGYRQAPSWIGPVTHPLIAALVVPATLLWRRRHGPKPASADVLLLLALLFLARCVLDAANNSYYHLPFLIALVAWEALQRERPPVFSVAAAGLVWLTVVKLPEYISPDAQWAAYMAWTLPALATMAYATFRRPYATRRSATTAASATRAPATA
jgi:glycosyl transferase family 87